MKQTEIREIATRQDEEGKTQIEERIFTIRSKQVMIDKDLALLYGVETRRLNEQVKRNIERFPDDFMFRLTQKEFDLISSEHLKSQIATSNWGGTRKLPLAFTENGIAMLSSILKSETAIAVNIRIMRAFTAKVSKQLQLDIDKHNAQYPQIEVRTFSKAHDRFLIIDDAVYLVGASIKDLGKKWFGFTLMENTDAEELLGKM